MQKFSSDFFDKFSKVTNILLLPTELGKGEADINTCC